MCVYVCLYVTLVYMLTVGKIIGVEIRLNQRSKGKGLVQTAIVSVLWTMGYDYTKKGGTQQIVIETKNLFTIVKKGFIDQGVMNWRPVE